MASTSGVGTATYRPRRASEVLLEANGRDSKVAKSAKSKVAKSGKGRPGSRKQYEMRAPFLTVRAIAQATGSAYVEMDGVKVLCGVYGPTSNERGSYSDKGSLSCSFEFAPFARETRRTRDDEREERAISLLLQEAMTVSIQLDKFPKAVLSAYVTVLEGGTGYLGAAITSVSLALADAGIELYGLVASTSVGLVRSEILVDPSPSEYESPDFKASLLLAYMPSLSQITYIDQDGTMDSKTAQEMVDLCCESCQRLHSMMRECLIKAAAGGKSSKALFSP
mmetsp:Transcript_10208/g.19602  ORF Transcript_10208/g.19602 Transcript_10208/m.19602 type:complete len:280 (-) Transcript_10208:149-988(-)